jgi:hypothetical protein
LNRHAISFPSITLERSGVASRPRRLLKGLDRGPIQKLERKSANILRSFHLQATATQKNLLFNGLAYLRKLHEGPDPRYTGC